MAGIGKAREARQANAAIAVQCGPWGWPGSSSRQAAGSGWQAGGTLAAAQVQAMGSWSLHVPMRTAVLPGWPRPQGGLQPLLLFGEEAKPLLLVLFAEAGIRGSEGR